MFKKLVTLVGMTALRFSTYERLPTCFLPFAFFFLPYFCCFAHSNTCSNLFCPSLGGLRRGRNWKSYPLFSFLPKLLLSHVEIRFTVVTSFQMFFRYGDILGFALLPFFWLERPDIAEVIHLRAGYNLDE